MNGSTTGVIPTFDVSGNGNNGGWGGSMGEWIIGLVALGMLGNGGLFGGFGGGGYGANMYEFPWLLTGQQGINNNTNQGFDTLHLSNQLEGVRDGIYSLSNQLCNCCSDMQSTVANGFYTSEVAANSRQMADMQQNFALSTQLGNASADNRLGIANLTSTVLSENCADRAALADGLKDVLINQTANTQSILDKLCQLELDSKRDRISELERENLMLSLDKSQTAQNAFIAQGLNNEVDALYNRLASCPVNTIPVYGNQRIFTCNNNGCGCNGNNGYLY